MTLQQFEFKLPTTTAHQARLRIFQPTRRPGFILDGPRIETAWGWVQMKNYRLGQGHADIVEGLMFHAQKHRFLDDGRIQIVIDPYRLRKLTGNGNVGSGEQIERIMIDLESAVLKMRIFNINGREIEIDGAIISDREKSKKRYRDPLNQSRGRPWWVVTFGRGFSNLIREDIKRFYDPGPIAQLSNGISQAVARLILTHSNQPNGGWLVDNVLKTVAGELDSVQMRNRKRELRNDAVYLFKIGIFIDKDRIKIRR
ncbi:MAG: hypothetical protein ACYCY8_10870 [Burkholderiales bacterium]